MFSLKEAEVKLAHVNVGAELHGEEAVVRLDLKIEAKVSNDRLFDFDPSLKLTLYVKSEDPDLLADKNHLTKLRYPKLGYPLRWDAEIVGAKFTIHHGIDETSNIVFDMANVNEFRIDPQEGGTVIITFRVQVHPDEEKAGAVAMMAGNKVTVTMTPPAEADPVGNVETEEK